MRIKEFLLMQIEKIIREMGAMPGGRQGDFAPVLDVPADLGHGDFTTNAAMILAKKLKKNPMEIAEEIVDELRKDNKLPFIEKIEVARPGFVNFWLNKKILLGQLEDFLTNGLSTDQFGKGKKVIVEYSSPNIAKPFTIGHLRSTIIGDALANLLEAVGFEVRRDNHVGDWGTQFGKQIFALKHIDVETGKNNEDLNDVSTLNKNIDLIEKSKRPVKLLVELYVIFHKLAEEKYPENEDRTPRGMALEDLAREYFRQLELNDPEFRDLWQKCIEWSWKEFEKIYQELEVSFTENNGRGYGESFFEEKMVSVLEELTQKKLLKESDGAKLVFFEKEKLPPLMIVKKDGATLYATRDLATDKFRKEKYGEDILIINEVGVEQSLYFQQLYEVEKILGWFENGQRIHIKHGHYRFRDEKMSTRKGRVIWLEDVLEEAKHRARELANDAVNYEGSASPSLERRKKLTGERYESFKNSPKEYQDKIKEIAIGALKWSDLKKEAKQDIVFDWDDILNMQGNSGPYLQYTYARTQSVLRKVKSSQSVLEKGGVKVVDLKPEELDLLRLLVRFGDTVNSAAEKYAPNIICNYLFVLAQAFNLFYQKMPILKAEVEARGFRLKLTEASGKVIKLGLNILGIQAPERM